MNTMNTEQKREVLAALVAIKKHGPIAKTDGICINVLEYLTANDTDTWKQFTWRLLVPYFRAWRHFSGIAVRPVPPATVNDRRYETDLWDNPLRWKLLDSIIRKLRRELKQDLMKTNDAARLR